MAADPQREPQSLDELLAEAIEAESDAGAVGPAKSETIEGEEPLDELEKLRAERDD